LNIAVHPRYVTLNIEKILQADDVIHGKIEGGAEEGKKKERAIFYSIKRAHVCFVTLLPPTFFKTIL